MKFISFDSCQEVLNWTNHLTMMKVKPLMPFRPVCSEKMAKIKTEIKKKINSKTEKKPKNITKNIWKETTYAEISFYWFRSEFHVCSNMKWKCWEKCITLSLGLWVTCSLHWSVLSRYQWLGNYNPSNFRKCIVWLFSLPPASPFLLQDQIFSNTRRQQNSKRCKRDLGAPSLLVGEKSAEFLPGVSGHWGGHFPAPLLPLCFCTNSSGVQMRL